MRNALQLSFLSPKLVSGLACRGVCGVTRVALIVSFLDHSVCALIHFFLQERLCYETSEKSTRFHTR